MKLAVLMTASLLVISACESKSPTAAQAATSSASSSSDGGSSGGSVSSTPTPSPAPAPLAACIDEVGVSRSEGSSWSSLGNATAYQCPGDSTSQLPESQATTYACVSGAVVKIEDGIHSAIDGAACSVPALSLSSSISPIVVGASATLTYTSSGVSSLHYSCSNAGTVVQSGSLSSAQGTFAITMSDDVLCSFSGTAESGRVFTVSVNQQVDCANKIKVGGHCQDFSCTSLVAVSPNSSGVIEVPARSANGVCYAYKLMSSLSGGASSLTATVDANVISRNHDVGFQDPNVTHNAYLMGQAQVSVDIRGPRTLKLAGSGDSLSPILVDNFVMVGIHAGSAPVVSDYKAYGTSDSTVGTTGGVLFNNSVVPLTPFATGGTSTIAPLNITDQVQVNTVTHLDVRAEDAGGSRALSDIYLVFQ